LRGSPPAPAAVAEALAPFREPAAEGLDAVALGCTHFPLIVEALAAALPPGVRWLDAAPAIARQLCRVLEGRGVATEAPPPGARSFLFTGPSATVQALRPALAGYGFTLAQPLR
ncbi:MAG: glutamate racemase, partial [Tistlia sp.]